jgi:hypothetical protein
MAYFVSAELARGPVFHHSELATAKTEPRPPLQLLAFQLIQLAFKDARSTNRIEAACALRWLRLRSDYSRMVRALRGTASADIKTAFVFQFDWACHLLDWDPETVRREGMPIDDSGTAKLHRWSGGGGLASWRRWRDERRRAQQLQDARATRRSERLERMAQARAQAQQTQHVSERPNAMAASV